jgi:hypothetical protein
MNEIHGGKKVKVAQFHLLCNGAFTGVEHKTNGCNEIKKKTE